MVFGHNHRTKFLTPSWNPLKRSIFVDNSLATLEEQVGDRNYEDRRNRPLQRKGVGFEDFLQATTIQVKRTYATSGSHLSMLSALIKNSMWPCLHILFRI